jgi:hypothetical protein
MIQVFACAIVNDDDCVMTPCLLALVAKNAQWYLAWLRACHDFFGQMNKKLRVGGQSRHYYDKKLRIRRGAAVENLPYRPSRGERAT